MKTIEILRELADRPYELLQSIHTAEMSKFKFITDTDLQYVIRIKPIMIQYNYGLLIMFAETEGKELTDTVTGRAGRDAFRIFSTVLLAVKSTLKHRNQLPIQYLRFTGAIAEQSRISLYERIIKNIGRYLPGWEFDHVSKNNGYITYVAKKTNSDQITEFVNETKTTTSNDLTTEFIEHYKNDPVGMFVHAKSSYLDAVSRAKNFSMKAAELNKSHQGMTKQEFQDSVLKHFGPHLKNHGFPKHASEGWGAAEQDMMKSLTQGVTEDKSTKKISFKLTKSRNKFSTTMMLDGVEAGVYQYDANSGRSIAEVFPEFKGQGFGKILILNAIYTAAKLGMDFIEDESRTAEYDNVLDSLSDSGYIVSDDGYLYVTGEGEKYLKQSLSLDEMALQTYKTMGDFTKPGPFTGADKKLVPHPKNIEKATRFFERTPFDFRLFFSHLKGTGKYSEHGPMSPDQIRQVFGQDAEEIINGSEDAITVVYVGNKGDAKVMLSPWVMAHRFGHSIQAGTSNQQWSAWREAEKYFFTSVNSFLEEHYGKVDEFSDSGYGRPKSYQMNYNLIPEYNALFNSIGTQRSSRSGQIRRPYEFLYELFAQYLGTGRVTLNPLPTNLAYGRKAWGNPTKYMNIKPEYRDEFSRKEEADRLAHTMEYLFDDVLSSSVSKIFVM